VLALQRRLRGLGYWLGEADGVYGDATTQAVMEFQGWERLSRDGIAGPLTMRALEHASRPTSSGVGDGIEIDKERQVLLLVRGGDVRFAFHTSTGTDQPYVADDGTEGVAHTPEGHFTVLREIEGWRESHLGLLWRPKYFDGGFAIHGATSVPGYPASHGCTRLSMEAMNVLWDDGLAPIGSKVWVY
jgi:peptidoglycan hydrolase-like protein with peptidoglycan-binding domain